MSKKLLAKSQKKQNSDNKLNQALKQASLDAQYALSPDDISSLNEFTSLVEHTPIAFETWQNSHEDLDLRIPLFVEAFLLSEGGLKQIEFTRTKLTSCQSSKKSSRHKEKYQLTIDIPRDCQSGHIFHFKGLGDEANSQVGDLFLTIYLKK